MNKLRIIRYAAWAVVVVVVAAVALIFYLRQTPLTPQVAIGGPFSLTDQTGRAVTEADLVGHPSVLFFGYTFCPDVCPTTLYEASGWLNDLGADGDKLKFYFITVDPARDTREQMAAYLGAFDPRITGLTGDRPAIDKMLKEYRVYSRKVPLDDGTYAMDHTASLYLLDQKGEFVSAISYGETKNTVMAKLERLIAGS